jgi:hypothetical protein
MNTTPESLRSTQTNLGTANVPAARRKFEPTQLFAQRDRLPLIWFCIAIGAIVFSAFDRFHLVNSLKQRERVVIIDPAGTYYLSPLLEFQEAKELHAQQATLAALAFLERNPRDFDHPELLKQLFLKSALNRAEDYRFKDDAEFRSKHLHQKSEVANLDILDTRDNEVLVNLTGQVIRNGVFQDKAFTEAFPFSLRLKLVRNPNMAMNGRYPTAVADFKYEINQ